MKSQRDHVFILSGNNSDRPTPGEIQTFLSEARKQLTSEYGELLDFRPTVNDVLVKPPEAPQPGIVIYIEVDIESDIPAFQ